MSFISVFLSALIGFTDPIVNQVKSAPIIIECDATAYCYGSITATGKAVRNGLCAMSSEYIGKTAIVYDSESMECLGIYEVEDTGSDYRIKNGSCIDIYNQSREWCLQFGRRKVVVYLYNAEG